MSLPVWRSLEEPSPPQGLGARIEEKRGLSRSTSELFHDAYDTGAGRALPLASLGMRNAECGAKWSRPSRSLEHERDSADKMFKRIPKNLGNKSVSWLCSARYGAAVIIQ